MEGALDAQSLISLSLRKIHSSRSQRGGIKLHKNLLVSYVLRNARQLYLSQRYAELCRRQQQQHPQLHYQPFPGAPTAGPDFHIPDDEGDASDDYPPPPPPHPHHQLRSCSLLGRSSEAMEDLPAPSGMRGEALAPFYPHRPLPPGSPLPPPYDFSSLHAQPPPLPSGHGSPTPAFPPPPPLPPCPSRTTVLDLDTHVVTTVDNGYLHQDCGCAQCPPVGAGTHPAAPPLPPPSPLSLLQTKRRYVQDVSIPPNGPERGAVEVVLGAPFPFKRKYDDPDSTGDPPRDHPTPPSRDPCPKRARLEDFSEPSSSSSNISNLISIFGSGFTGLVGRQQQQQQQQVLLQQQLPSPSAQQVWHQQVPQASSCSTATAAATAAQPIDPEQQQQQQQQQHLNGQLCSKQALASLGAWTRAIVAF